MDNIEKAREIYERIQKANADSPWVDMPSATSSDPEMDLRAREGNEAIYNSDIHNLRQIGLGRELMSIDVKSHGVSRKTANKIAEYIERNEETALMELRMEYSVRVKELYSLLQLVKKINKDEFETKEDFERALAYEYRKLKEFENKLNYLAEVIHTVEAYETNFEERIDDKEDKKFQEDFDFSFTQSFWNSGMPMGGNGRI